MEIRGDARAFGAFLDRTLGNYQYLIGTRGQMCTESLIKAKRAQYPAYAAKIDACAMTHALNHIVVDCMGWFEAYYNGADVDKPAPLPFKYGDVSTGIVYSLVKTIPTLQNGPIETLPTNRAYPIAVGYTGHVGFFYKGKVYQAAGHCVGTIATALKDLTHNSAWVYWYELPWLTIGEGATVVWQRGDKGEGVRSWQAALVKYGIPLPKSTLPDGTLDGVFGPETETATATYQSKVGLIQTGIADNSTVAKMLDYLRVFGGCGDELAACTLALAHANAEIASLNAQLESTRLELVKTTAEREAQKARAEHAIALYDDLTAHLRAVYNSMNL